MAKDKSGLPQINLKMGDFFHKVPEASNFEIMLVYKLGTAPNDFINPVDTFAVEGEYLVMTNRRSEYVYRVAINKLKAAYLIPMGE